MLKRPPEAFLSIDEGGIPLQGVVPAPAVEDDEPEIWFLDVSGIGSVVEGSFKLALGQAKHYRDRGHHVVIRRTDAQGNPRPTPIKPILLRWDELKPGAHWAIRIDGLTDEHAHLVEITLLASGSLGIELDGVEHRLSEEWDMYQFLPCERPTLAQVTTQQTV